MDAMMNDLELWYAHILMIKKYIVYRNKLVNPVPHYEYLRILTIMDSYRFYQLAGQIFGKMGSSIRGSSAPNIHGATASRLQAPAARKPHRARLRKRPAGAAMDAHSDGSAHKPYRFHIDHYI